MAMTTPRALSRPRPVPLPVSLVAGRNRPAARSWLAGLGALLALAACEPLPPETGNSNSGRIITRSDVVQQQDSSARLDADTAARNFVSVVRRMEPAIEAECHQRAPNANCDFRIVVDDTPGQSPNAFQTLDKNGQPIVAFNLALIAEARNTDELAFVMGHEAAHHIAGHIPRQQQSASLGGMVLGGLAAASGFDSGTVQTAQNLGAGLAGRAYAKDYELEADRLGTIIAWDAGYDPVRGSAFFNRLPDPGDRFLGSHPPNASRLRIVQQTVADLRAGRLR